MRRYLTREQLLNYDLLLEDFNLLLTIEHKLGELEKKYRWKSDFSNFFNKKETFTNCSKSYSKL